MVHVKVVNIMRAQSISCIHGYRHLKQRWSLKLTLDLDSDTFWYFNHRRWTLQHSTASKLQIARGMVCSMHDAIYSTRIALVIYRIMSAKRICEVRPVVLIRESSTQLLIYSLDTCVRHSTYLPIFNSQKGPEFLGNYFIDYVIITS